MLELLTNNGYLSRREKDRQFAEFEKKCRANLALDADGHLTYLAASEWRMGFTMEDWPDVAFRKTREHN